jgi:hypothetical protein
MTTPAATKPPTQRHASPPLGLLAIVVTVLFCAGLYPVTPLGGTPSFPTPFDSAQTIAAFFELRPTAAQLCAFLQFGAAIPLGIFTATIVSRLQFLGVRAAGIHIALFGGLAAAFAEASSALGLWSIAHPGIAQDATLTRALYLFFFALGGPGYSVPMGLLMAGVSVVTYFTRFVPRWISIFGLALAVCGELSWLSLEFPQAMALIPLTRFPGFVWMIAVGFALPNTRPATGQGGTA